MPKRIRIGPKLIFPVLVAIGMVAAARLIPEVGGLVALTMPVLVLLRALRKPIRAHWVSLLLPAGAAVIALLVQLTLFSRSEPVDLWWLAAIPGAGFGLLFGLFTSIRESDNTLVVKGLALPLLAWQCTLLASQASATFGLVGLVELVLLTGVITTGSFVVASSIAWLKSLASHHSPGLGRTMSSPPLPEAGMAWVGAPLVLLLFGFGVQSLWTSGEAASVPQVRAGLWRGTLNEADERYVLRENMTDTGQQTFFLESTPAALRVYSDGTAELVGEVVYRARWALGPPPHEQWENRFTSAGRHPITAFKVHHVEISTYRQTRRRVYPDDSAPITVDRDGSILLELDNGHVPVRRDIPYRLRYVGGDGAATGSSADPGSRPGSSGISGSMDPMRQLEQLIQAIEAEGDLSDEAIQAGIVAGLLLLLAGVGINMATALAISTAQNVAGTFQYTPFTSGTRTLSGSDARQWLEDEGFIDAGGNFTQAYSDWTNGLYTGPSSPLHHIQYGSTSSNQPAGPIEQDRRLPNHGELHIIVRDGGPKPDPVPPPKPPTPPPVPPKPPAPPAPPKPQPPPRAQTQPAPVVDPCAGERAALARIQKTGEAMVAESRRLRSQMLELRERKHAEAITGAASLLIDSANAGLTIALSGAEGFLSTVKFSVLQNAFAEEIKVRVKQLYFENPDGFWTSVGSSLFWTGVGKAAAQRLEAKVLEMGTRAGVGQAVALTHAAEAKMFANAATQSMWTMYSAGKEYSRTILRIHSINERLSTLVKLRRNTRRLIAEERQNKSDALKALEDCLRRNGLPVNPGGSSWRP